MFQKALKHHFLQKADCVAVFLPHLSITAYSCIAFPSNSKSRADRTQSWGTEWMDTQNKLFPWSGSSERHRSNLDLDPLLTAEGHSNVRRFKFCLKGGIWGPHLTCHGGKWVQHFLQPIRHTQTHWTTPLCAAATQAWLLHWVTNKL